jgi:hypothetical protein
MDIPSEILSNGIERGTILHSNMFPMINHGKFFIVIGESKEYLIGFFFINSHINAMLERHPEFMNLQYILKCKDYKFLDHDSFVCASEILKISKSKLIDSIERRETKIIDILKEKHLEELLEMVRNSDVFSNNEKREFF